MVSANTKQKKMWWNGSQGAHTSAVIKFLSALTTHTGATCNQPVDIAGVLAFGATRCGWSGLLSGPVTVVPERDACGDRRTRSRVGVGAGRNSRDAATVFFVFFDQQTVEAGETERRRLVFQGLEKKNTGSTAIKTGSAHQFNPNTYRMKVQG
jgi:hypothetical protein